MGEFGDKIIGRLKELAEAQESGEPIEITHTVRKYRIPQPAEIDAAGVKAIRETYGMSQAMLAGFLGVSVQSVRAWEQGIRKPSPMAFRFLGELKADPAHYRKRFAKLAVVK